MGTWLASPTLILLIGFLSVRDNPEWRRPKGQPRNSWLGKIDRSCRDRLEMDRAAAWEFARGDRLGWRQLVSEVTRPLAYAPRLLVSNIIPLEWWYKKKLLSYFKVTKYGFFKRYQHKKYNLKRSLQFFKNNNNDKIILQELKRKNPLKLSSQDTFRDNNKHLIILGCDR